MPLLARFGSWLACVVCPSICACSALSSHLFGAVGVFSDILLEVNVRSLTSMYYIGLHPFFPGGRGDQCPSLPFRGRQPLTALRFPVLPPGVTVCSLALTSEPFFTKVFASSEVSVARNLLRNALTTRIFFFLALQRLATGCEYPYRGDRDRMWTSCPVCDGRCSHRYVGKGALLAAMAPEGKLTQEEEQRGGPLCI
jgi:hypothetical protein